MLTIKKLGRKNFCTNCKKRVYRSIGRINENLKLGHNFYCSRKCEFQCKSKKQLLACENCGKSFTRSPHAISPHNYCSRSCAVIVNNRKHSKRKTELKTCMRCSKQFKKSTGNLNFCSIKCRVEAKRRYTPEQLIDIIKSTTQAIIDNWLTENKIPHERNVFYPGTNYKADWSVGFGNRNIFVEYFGLANNSPRYDRSVRKKKLICEKYKLKLIEIYPKDLYPEIRFDTILRNEFEKLGWRK